MTLEQRVNDDIKQAMLAKQPERLAALRAVKAAILLEKTSGTAHELTDADVVKAHAETREAAAESAGSIPQPDVPSFAANELCRSGHYRGVSSETVIRRGVGGGAPRYHCPDGSRIACRHGESDGSGDQEAGRPGGWQGDIRGCQEAAELRPGCGRYRLPSFRRRCSGWRQP